MGLAGAGSEGDRLQHLRSVVPCQTRVTARTHPLFGELLAAQSFRRVDGVVYLVVDLPDGSPGTIRLDATDVLGVLAAEPVGTVLTAEGVHALRKLVLASRSAGESKPGRARIASGEEV